MNKLHVLTAEQVKAIKDRLEYSPYEMKADLVLLNRFDSKTRRLNNVEPLYQFRNSKLEASIVERGFSVPTGFYEPVDQVFESWGRKSCPNGYESAVGEDDADAEIHSIVVEKGFLPLTTGGKDHITLCGMCFRPTELPDTDEVQTGPFTKHQFRSTWFMMQEALCQTFSQAEASKMFYAACKRTQILSEQDQNDHFVFLFRLIKGCADAFGLKSQVWLSSNQKTPVKIDGSNDLSNTPPTLPQAEYFDGQKFLTVKQGFEARIPIAQIVGSNVEYSVENRGQCLIVRLGGQRKPTYSDRVLLTLLLEKCIEKSGCIPSLMDAAFAMI